MTRCLVVAPAWIGDMIMAQSLFHRLHHGLGYSVDVLAPQWTQALTERMPEVSHALTLPLAHRELGLQKRFQLGKALRAAHYDVAYVLPNSLKSALIPFFARIPKRIGFVGEQRFGLLTQWYRLDKQALPLMVERFVALSYASTINASEFDYTRPKLICHQTEQQAVANHYGLNQKNAIALCPGAAFGPAKRWPLKHFEALAKQLATDGFQPVIFGGAAEVPLGEAIKASAPTTLDLTGKTTLSEAIDLMGLTQAVLANDSGLMHIAAALDKPLVAIYGSSDAGFTPPLSKKAKIVETQLDCRPCFKRECPYGHLKCLEMIHPKQVRQQLMQVMAGE